MRILITSGGTREPIDEVRYVGNVASGRTGALIAAEAVRRFHTVYLLHGVGSVMPPDWALDTGLLKPLSYTTTVDLLESARQLCERGLDAVVASAAVADFSPIAQTGKLSSKQEELVVRMRPTPKVIDRLREWLPEALLVAFKLETGISQAAIEERARATMARSGADYIVANDLSGFGTNDHPCRILGRDGGEQTFARRSELAAGLLDILEQRRRT